MLGRSFMYMSEILGLAQPFLEFQSASFELVYHPNPHLIQTEMKQTEWK